MLIRRCNEIARKFFETTTVSHFVEYIQNVTISDSSGQIENILAEVSIIFVIMPATMEITKRANDLNKLF